MGVHVYYYSQRSIFARAVHMRNGTHTERERVWVMTQLWGCQS